MVWIPPRWRAGGDKQGTTSSFASDQSLFFFCLQLVQRVFSFSSPPCFSSSLPFSAASASLHLSRLSFSRCSSSSSRCLALVLPVSVALAGLAAHLSEVRPTAELELQHQRTVRHFVYIFAFCREKEERRMSHVLNE